MLMIEVRAFRKL